MSVATSSREKLTAAIDEVVASMEAQAKSVRTAGDRTSQKAAADTVAALSVGLDALRALLNEYRNSPSHKG